MMFVLTCQQIIMSPSYAKRHIFDNYGNYQICIQIYNHRVVDMLVQDTSLTDIKLDNTHKDTKSSFASAPVNTAAINELELQVDKKNESDLQQITKILKQILDYPDLEKTEMHTRAMKLGNFDLQNQQQPAKNRLDTNASMVNEPAKSQFCPCCGFKIQQENIKLCTSFTDIKNMGLSTYLFFSTFKNLSILLTILLVIYSGYSLATNVLAANVLNASGSISYSKIDYINISLSSKQTNDTPTNRLYYYVSCWLGVATAVIWLLVIFAIKYYEVKDSNEYDSDTISCSDYSIVIEGLPLNVNIQQLQKQFDQYFETTIKNSSRFPAIWKQPLKIVKVNVGKPFYLHQDELKDQEIEQINKEIKQLKEKIAQWIVQRQSSKQFKTSKSERESSYQKYAQLIQRRNNKYLEISNKITSILKKETGEREDLTNVFITFQLNNNKTILNFIHESGILSKIRSLCNAEHQRFTYKQDGKEYRVRLSRAPEPEDIIWTNIGQNNCVSYMKKFFTFSITVILLGISFAIVYGLTKLQQAKNDDRMVSIAISATIGGVNAIIGQVIRYLTLYQKDYTQTQRQASLSLKSILAQMVNSILIPVITAYYIKGNLYSVSGLVDNIFMLSITTSIVPPLLVILDPYNIFVKIMRCFKSKPTSKLQQTQKEHNSLHQGLQFQVGYHYIYPVNVFVFVCYFVSLQPIVALIGLTGYFLMYWAQKYCLFNRYRRPVPGTDFVNNAVYRIILMGPFIFSLGSLTWSNFTPGGIPPEALLPNLVILGISLIIYLIPYNTVILGSCFSNNYERNKNYDDERIIFPSQYDRLNPSTKQEGMEDYKKYLQRKMKEIQQMSEEKRAQFAQKFMINAQRAQAVQRGNSFNMGMQNYRVVQPMPFYQQFPQMGFSPFSPGFNYAPYRVVPGIPFTPPLPHQPYPQVMQQPRPMGPAQIYPSPAPMAPQPGFVPQGYPNNQVRPAVYQAVPIYNNKVQVINTNSQRNPYPQPQPQPQPQMSSPFNPPINHVINVNPTSMGIQGGYVNRPNNRGW